MTTSLASLPAVDVSVETACVTCGATMPAPFLSLPDLPVMANDGWFGRDDALAVDRGTIVLSRCDGCGLVRNVAFRPELVDYSPRYENSLHHSPRFDRFARSLAGDLVARYGLVGGSVAEIGAGRGDFLRLLASAGVAQVTGIDPAADADDAGPVRGEAFDSQELVADMVCARHVLEHVDDPLAFLHQVRAATRSGTAFYFEVPNAEWMLRRGGVWDVIYEHCTYFDAGALHTLLDRAGYAVERIDTAFDDQFLAASGRIDGASLVRTGTPGPDGAALVHRFADEAADLVLSWALALRSRSRRGERIALWGAGSKGTTFLNLVPASDAVGVVVDVNPRKHGTHVPGTGHEVVPPERLRAAPPDVVIVANAAYTDEIRASLRSLGVRADVHVL